MTNITREQLEQALQKCASEPIHQIGRIQPHGVLLVLDPASALQIVQASVNLDQIFEVSAEQALGLTFADLGGARAAEQLQALTEVALGRDTAAGKLSMVVAGASRELQAHVYLSNGGFAVELMADQTDHKETRLAELLLQMQDVLLHIDTDREYLRYFDQVAILVRTLCGYDSVMVYRFDSEWNGEVISQSRIETAPSYLGLHFPASDIPAQARRLYTLNLVRVVADIEADPVPLLPALNPLAAEPLDMTYSALRCLSPIHIQYLRNIGVSASMVVSIMQNGRLWGLIACHHHAPKQVSLAEREAVTFISRMTSAKLSGIEAVEQHRHVTSANHLIGELLNYIFTSQEETILQRLLPELMQLLHADGVVALVEGKRHCHGLTPDSEQLDGLLQWLSGKCGTSSFSCDHLEQHFPPAMNYRDIASGVLCTPLSAGVRNGIVWFRVEKPRTVNWAGHAEKGLVADEAGGYRLTPRKSFEVWSELWRGRSAPWTHVELGVANMLAITLPEGLAQKSRLDQALKAQRLLDAELRIAATAFESQEGILVLDSAHNILRVNRAFSRITGYPAEFVVGKNPRDLQLDIQRISDYAAMWDAVEADGAWEGETILRSIDGRLFPIHLAISAVTDQEGNLKNYVASFIDISQLKAASEEIERLAFYDALTGLPNRRLLQDRLKHCLAISSRSGRPGALLFIDLDNFKMLNDTLGHDMGDLLLQQVGRRLSGCVREGDTVARLGGDEFVVMLSELGDDKLDASAQTEIVANKILVRLTKPYLLKEHEYRNSPSIGAVLFRDHEFDIEALLKQADIAMYQAKKAGKNTVRFFDPQMQANINARMRLEAELHRALAENRFLLHYQPQVGKNHEVSGAEVLIRCLHPESGLIPPKDFIPLAEEIGLITPIGQWVLETACRQLKRWEANPNTRHLQLAVNVSPRQFRQADFVGKVVRIVRDAAIKPGHLKLELTESLVLDDIDDTIVKMHALRNFGVCFAMDDFGTGNSSLSNLRKLPIAQLKIDQSFIRDILENPDDTVIVQTIIAMAKNLGMDVIAEGVETGAQRSFLEQHGCDAFQGYLFGKPMPITDFEALLRGGLPQA
ncbi:EAL domain-containing protein [Methylomonas sp. EFPC3]|uniref:bifunctional diguanylate cyclase/phosphodiesterase n=1 Tax=Methylomonas sp. EFPC3 TaxID=3021710 RepID=UPI0024174EA9|nr:EAL domain-containing protein [Methylomonas sp. EFPC3]WFP51852.1 EAL domain-containing protein [Methylomonas sp. EFPC3]